MFMNFFGNLNIKITLANINIEVTYKFNATKKFIIKAIDEIIIIPKIKLFE